MSVFIPPSINTAARSGLVLELGEIVYDSDEKRVYFGDGSTAGGIRLAIPSDINIISENLVLHVGSSRELKTLDEAYLQLKKYSLGEGVTVQIRLDTGTYSPTSAAVSSDIMTSITIMPDVSGASVIIGGASASWIFNNCNTTLEHLTIQPQVCIYGGVCAVNYCMLTSTFRGDFNSTSYLFHVDFARDSASPLLTAMYITGRSYADYTYGNITNYGTGIKAETGGYVDVGSIISMSGVDVEESPEKNTTDINVTGQGYIHDDYR